MYRDTEAGVFKYMQIHTKRISTIISLCTWDLLIFLSQVSLLIDTYFTYWYFLSNTQMIDYVTRSVSQNFLRRLGSGAKIGTDHRYISGLILHILMSMTQLYMDQKCMKYIKKSICRAINSYTIGTVYSHVLLLKLIIIYHIILYRYILYRNYRKYLHLELIWT